VPDRPFPVVKAIVRRAERIASKRPDPTAILADVIRQTAARDADPYLVLGVLIEGAAHTLAARIPSERRGDTAMALLQLLSDRLKAHGVS
jgi:hypothetical protein